MSRRTHNEILQALALTALMALTLAPAGVAQAGTLQLQLYPRVGSSQLLPIAGRVIRDRRGLLPSGEGRRGRALHENLGALLSHDLEGVTVQLKVASLTQTVVTDEEGFFRLLLKPSRPLPLGRTLLRARVAVGKEQARAQLPILIRARSPSLVVVTDFDDTLVHTQVLNRSAFLRSVFLRRASELEPVKGMAVLLSCLAQGVAAVGPYETVIHYLSASPVNFNLKLKRFLAGHRFPPGAIYLRHLTVSTLKDSEGYKLQVLNELALRYPEAPLLLIGDGGEKDPEVYKTFRAAHPKHPMTVMIRRVEGEDATPSRFEGMIRFSEGAQAGSALLERSLLDPSCAAALNPSVLRGKGKPPQTEAKGTSGSLPEGGVPASNVHGGAHP